jgi:hypothetical protein
MEALIVVNRARAPARPLTRCTSTGHYAGSSLIPDLEVPMTRARIPLYSATLLAMAACASEIAVPTRDLPTASAASKQQPGPGEVSSMSGGETAPTDSTIAGNMMGSGH